MCGHLNVRTRGSFEYFIIFIDDYSMYDYVYLFHYKSKVFEKFKEFDVGLLSTIKIWLVNHFDMKDLGEAYILGIKHLRDRRNKMLDLSHAAYIDKILVKFAMHNSKK